MTCKAPTSCRHPPRAAGKRSRSWTPTATPNAASDLAAYRSAAGLPACGVGCFSVVNQNGATSPLPANAGTTGWDVEESLDIDMVSATCPLCHIILVEASAPTDGDLGTAVNAAVNLGVRSGQP